MTQHELIISVSAAEAFRDIIRDLQQVSLLSAEKVRSRIMHKLHLIQHQPMQASKKIELAHEGHFRCATVLNYKIYYQVASQKILVVSIVYEK
jgi:plasmid stabilization system protein ParE